MSANKWLSILKWKKLPPFSDIHEMDIQDFLNNYYDAHPDLQGLAASMLSGLRGEQPPNNMRIQGRPGIGKTTFLHYIKACLETERIESGDKDHTFLYILDCRSLVTHSEIQEARIDDRILKSIECYCDNCKVSSSIISDIRSNSSLSERQKIDKLLDYYTNHKGEFTKKYVIALDAVDTINKTLIIPLLISITNRLHQSSLKKWLFIRDVTYSELKEEIKLGINTFFPEPHNFPYVDLNEIIKLRIAGVATKKEPPKNPFDNKLCNFLCKIFNDDLRQAIPMLKIILDEVPPKLTPEFTDEKFIRNYISRMAVQVLLRANVIPNIYDSTITSNPLFPLQKEVLELLAHYQIIDKIFVSILEEEISLKLMAVRKDKKLNMIKIERKIINETIQFLLEHSIIEPQETEDTNKETYKLTKLGWELEKIVSQDFYIDICKETILKTKGGFSENYWRICSVKSDYYALVIEKLFKIPAEYSHR
jgi:hypothetical protein